MKHPYCLPGCVSEGVGACIQLQHATAASCESIQSHEASKASRMLLKKENFKIPKGLKAEDLTFEDCKRIILEGREAGKKTKQKR